MSVVDAQAFCQGLYFLLEQKQPQARTLSLYNYQSATNTSYYPANSAAGCLGFDFGIEIYAGYTGASLRARVSRPNSMPSLTNYVEQKNQSLSTLSKHVAQWTHQMAGEQPHAVRNSLM